MEKKEESLPTIVLDCLADVDLEYARKVNMNDDSNDIKKSTEAAFQQERRELQYVRQQDGEIIEEFANASILTT